MKRFTFIITSLLISLSCMAQSGHMTFMGIPLNGTINSFQSKLAAKGIKPDTELNRQFPVGTRAFKGGFAGHEADIYVYYDDKTKNVYRAKACIISEAKHIAEQTYNTIKIQLQDKYYNNYSTEDTYEGNDALNIFTPLGTINLYLTSYSTSYPTRYTVHVDYYDNTNFNKYNNSVKEDL